jgi:hypothetical protein
MVSAIQEQRDSKQHGHSHYQTLPLTILKVILDTISSITRGDVGWPHSEVDTANPFAVEGASY